jgi:hypothetical protein
MHKCETCENPGKVREMTHSADDAPGIVVILCDACAWETIAQDGAVSFLEIA